MTMKSTLGGALSAFGVFLFGAPALINATSPDFPKPAMVWLMGTGLILNGLGIFFGLLFSADSKHLKELGEKVEANTTQIASTKEAVRSGIPESTSKP